MKPFARGYTEFGFHLDRGDRFDLHLSVWIQQPISGSLCTIHYCTMHDEMSSFDMYIGILSNDVEPIRRKLA